MTWHTHPHSVELAVRAADSGRAVGSEVAGRERAGWLQQEKHGGTAGSRKRSAWGRECRERQGCRSVWEGGRVIQMIQCEDHRSANSWSPAHKNEAPSDGADESGRPLREIACSSGRRPHGAKLDLLTRRERGDFTLPQIHSGNSCTSYQSLSIRSLLSAEGCCSPPSATLPLCSSAALFPLLPALCLFSLPIGPLTGGLASADQDLDAAPVWGSAPASEPCD